MRFSTFVPALIVPLAMGTPIAEPIASVAATESEYSLLTRDLPADLAVRDPAVSEEQYHYALSKRGCDPIGCYANGFFSVIFNSNGALTLYGEGQAPQGHPFPCNGNYDGFTSWLPYVFSAKEDICGQPLLRGCCNSIANVHFLYASIKSDPINDSRCGPAGTNQRRCIFPIRP